MDAIEGDFNFLVQSIGRSIEDLRGTIPFAEDEEQQRGRQLCAYVRAALTTIESRVALLVDEFSAAADDEARAAIARQLRLLNVEVRALHTTTPWLESLGKSSLSLGQMYLLDEGTRALLRGDADLVLVPDPTYMYSNRALKPSFDELLGQLGNNSPEGPPPLVITYPQLEEGRLLLHPIFAHELGHGAIERHDLRRRSLQRYPQLDALNEKFGEAVKSLVAEMKAETGNAPSEEEAAVQLRQVLNWWIDEALCDQLALAYMGPSFVFALAAFLFPIGSTELTETHPPPSLRAALLSRSLAALEWRRLLEDRLPQIVAWLDWISGLKPKGGAPAHVVFMYEALEDLGDSMFEEAAAYVGDFSLGPEAYEDRSAELEELLEHGIPPIQLGSGEPADRRAVLVAAWIHHLARYGDDPSSIAKVLGDAEIQRLVAQATEMSVVLERWRGP